MNYPSDLKERNVIKHHFDSGNYGKRSKYNKEEGVNEVFYMIKSGCQWRILPKDFPPYWTVHSDA
ncbi:transposase [Holospora elegans]|uniref:transposase n=1 Tax=Holospora elegans TaxID=431043 RepID=UPI000695E3E1